MPHSKLNRRAFLRAAGVSIALPALDAWPLGFARGGETPEATPDIRRFVGICAPLGIHTPYLFPEKSGRDYDVTPYLEPLQSKREKFSVLSGLLHPGVDGGHSAEKSFLTGAAHPGQPSFRNTISLDQFAAERMGHLTRFPSLVLSAAHLGLSYTRSGVRIPPEREPSRVFRRFFLEGSPEEKARQIERIREGQSILDLVLEQTRQLDRGTGRDDRRTLDQYLSSIRELERRLVLAEDWAKKPKPEVEQDEPEDIKDRADFSGRMELMYDLIALALQTDSTRLVSFCGAAGNEVVKLDGVEDGWHNLSHHGKNPEKIEQLARIELEEMKLFARFLEKLDSIREGEHTLLDQTAIVMGSNLGNASSHSNSNLPIVTAGGRFRHGQHLAFDPAKPPPLANLFVSCLEHLGIEEGQFATGTGTLEGLS